MTLSLWTALAFADASALWAETGEVEPVEVASSTVQVMQIDFMTTGPTTSDMPRGVLHQLDACSAECQAERLGLVFDD